METSTDSATGGAATNGTSSEATAGTRRKLSDQQEAEVTRLYAETDTPVSEISKRFGIGESSVYRVAQRHGASLRGRTSTGTSGSGTSSGTGARRGRRPGSRSAATGSSTAAASSGTGTGRRGRRPGSGAGAASTTATTG